MDKKPESLDQTAAPYRERKTRERVWETVGVIAAVVLLLGWMWYNQGG